MKKILILVEGETEKKLVNTLSIAGKVQIVNLWEKPVSRIIPRIKEDIVLIIFDTDTLGQTDFFKSNLQMLEKHRIKFSLIQQTHNLEDEIVRCSQCKRIQDMFNTQGIKEFKNQWGKCQNLSKKLNDVNFDSSELWTGNLIQTLSPWQPYQKSFLDLQFKNHR